MLLVLQRLLRDLLIERDRARIERLKVGPLVDDALDILGIGHHQFEVLDVAVIEAVATIDLGLDVERPRQTELLEAVDDGDDDAIL